MKIFLLLTLTVLLGACGGGNGTALSPTASSGEDSPAATSPVLSTGGGTFNVTISGAIQTSFSGSTNYLVSESEDGVTDMLLVFNTPDNAEIVNIGMPYVPEVGTYPLDPTGESLNSPIMSYAHTSGENVSIYDAVQGELVIEVANPMSGRFEFTGQSLEGEEVGITGTFSQLTRSAYPTMEPMDESEE